MYAPTNLYFSYGTNLLAFRIHMHCPQAEFVSIGRADNYRLDFITYSKFWDGPSATLVPTANAHVWGVIWKLNENDVIQLNYEKELGIKTYMKYIDVLTPYMGSFTCCVYAQKAILVPRGDKEVIPVERWPSWAYKETMITGAKEHQLPPYYIDFLKTLKHNGGEGGLRTACLLNRYAKNNPCECRVPGRIPRKPLKLELKKK